MAVVAHADNKRKYSWWWDSHISPKNSKWLQENLTDMDSKVKQMIKVIEEDADSFARRAEMYYKKRPELMKLVEEFYRAYRALAERYDHATGVIRHAHRTMAEAFPNQVPAMFMDDSLAGEVEPRTLEMTPGRAMFEPDELQKDALGLSSHAVKMNGVFTDESDTIPRRKGFKQLSDSIGSGELRARKGLNFHNLEESDDSDLKARVPSESDRLSKAEMEILTLKNSLAKLEAEKEAGLIQYHESLDRLSNLEKEVVRAQEGSRGLHERASFAEAEVQSLKGALAKLEAEREASLAQYEQCVEKISHLENSNFQAEKDVGELNERASKAEIEAQSLKQELDSTKEEKEASLTQYMQCLEKISNLEERLLRSEENAERMKDRAERAEKEIETLKQAVAELTNEKETAAVQYQQCLEKIANLEQQIVTAEEGEGRLKSELLEGAAKLQNAEERCTLLESSNQSLHTELESLIKKTTAQSEELTEKQKELGRLWASIQEERLRFVEAETAFQTLQHLHSQSQEDLRSLATELQNRAQVIMAIESRNQGLANELKKVKEENKSLNELNLSSEVSIKNVQEEIFNLRETIRKLEAEVELRVDQRNALQQEIYCLKEERNELNKRHQEMTAKVESVGLNPECFESSVKDLQEENVVLKAASQREKDEKTALSEKLSIMEELIQKNALLENSLSDLNVELVSIRDKVMVLEDCCQSLSEEKSNLAAEKDTLLSQLYIANENSEKLSEKNNLLENSLFDANAELESVKAKLQRLENSCLLLVDEKSNLVNERDGVASELEISQKRLADADNLCTELRENCMSLEKQKDFAVDKVKDLENSLDMAKKELTRFLESSAIQLATLESQAQTLEAENQGRREEYEDELVRAETQIFILRECMQELEEKNISLSVECRKLLECSTLSEKLITELQHENLKKDADINSINAQIDLLRIGFHQVLKIVDISTFNHDNEIEMDNMAEQDKRVLHHILARFSEMWSSILQTQANNHELAVENAVLIAFLAQRKEEVKSLVMEKHAVQEELRSRSTQFLDLQNECQKLAELGEELKSKLTEGGCREESMQTEMQYLRLQLQELQEVYQTLLAEKSIMLQKNRSLGEEKSLLDEENNALLSEVISHSNTCVIFKEIIAECSKGIDQLSSGLEKLSCLNGHLEDKLKILEKHILNLSGEYNCQYKETESVRQINLALESELVKLREELEEMKYREEELHQEIKNTKSEVELWEKEAALLFGEQQVLSVHGNFLEGKAYELADAYKHLAEQSTSQALEVDQLENRLCTLEGENEGLKAHLKAYAPAVTSLNNSLVSLESLTVLHSNVPTTENDEAKEVDPVSELSADKHEETPADEMASISDVLSNLQAMPMRVEAVAKKVVEMERLAVFENSNATSKLEAALRQIEELKSGSSSRRDSFRVKKHANGKQEGYSDPKMQRSSQEIYEETDEVTKDIMLDQVSDSSSYGISRRETGGDDQMLELWETAEYDGSINMKVGKANRKAVTVPSDFNINQVEAEKKRKGKTLSTDSLVKDLGVDKLEISSRFVEPGQEPSQRKILDRLDSDAQKLTNLQITVGDLKRKVDFTEKGKKVKGIEYGTVKEQLEEAEEAITKLFSANHKLITHIENGSLSHEGKSTTEPDEAAGIRRRRIAEQARRLSEKVGRLQLEVQKIQFLLMKLNDEKESKGKLRIAERRTRVLLRDYLYGGGIRSGQRSKRPTCCSCVEPSTRGD